MHSLNENPKASFSLEYLVQRSLVRYFERRDLVPGGNVGYPVRSLKVFSLLLQRISAPWFTGPALATGFCGY
jgi:hypothetical protein